MTENEFAHVLEGRIDEMRRVLGVKSGEYTSNKDRLGNFKDAARMLRCNPSQALIGMLAKHLVSIFDLVNSSVAVKPGLPIWSEKIGDAINYLVLLYALQVEIAGDDVDREGMSCS